VRSNNSSNKIVLIIEYEGTRYHGFQYQIGVPTIQGEIEKALLKFIGERRRVMTASRTDAGVHARGQVVSFRTQSDRSIQTYVNGLNYYLPSDIAVREVYKVSSEFNVRREARSREYRYCILNSMSRSAISRYYSYLVRGNLNIENMNLACQALIGTHDFASFLTGDMSNIKSTVRNVFQAVVKREEEMVLFDVEANAFLPHQVRNTVGALIKVGLGKITVNDFIEMMEERKPGLAGPTAPARGLYLMRVNYPVPFQEINNENL